MKMACGSEGKTDFYSNVACRQVCLRKMQFERGDSGDVPWLDGWD